VICRSFPGHDRNIHIFRDFSLPCAAEQVNLMPARHAFPRDPQKVALHSAEGDVFKKAKG
jgi:hypothetical protein